MTSAQIESASRTQIKNALNLSEQDIADLAPRLEDFKRKLAQFVRKNEEQTIINDLVARLSEKQKEVLYKNIDLFEIAIKPSGGAE